MNVMSLWILRTSKIFCRPRPSCLSQVRFLSMSSQFVLLLAELPRVPAVLDVAEQLDAQLVRVEPAARCVAIVPEWWSA